MAERGLRLEEEHKLLGSVFPGIVRSGDWFLIPDDARATRAGWSPSPFPVAFHAQAKHPGQVPYGIYVARDVRVHGRVPNNFKANCAQLPPFEGEWGVLSWQGDGQGIAWVPSERIREGANLLDFAVTFQERFNEGV